MCGVAEGCTAGGTKTTIEEILAWNNYFLLTESWYNNQSEDGAKRNARPGGEGGGIITNSKELRQHQGFLLV